MLEGAALTEGDLGRLRKWIRVWKRFLVRLPWGHDCTLYYSAWCLPTIRQGKNEVPFRRARLVIMVWAVEYLKTLALA
jgi:hypothetical protein